LTETPARVIDVRVGSATDGRAPISVVERSLSAGAFHWLGLIAIALAAVLADQVTKAIVAGQLALGESVHVGGPLSIHHVRNTGIAFGLFGGWAGPVTILTGIAILWMVGYFAKAGAGHPILPVALGLLIGGSVANLADRIRLGHVRDFLDFQYWPAFNLADAFICVGVGVLLLTLVAAERRAGFHHRSAPRASA
jgi:signal peptidase II